MQQNAGQQERQQIPGQQETMQQPPSQQQPQSGQNPVQQPPSQQRQLQQNPAQQPPRQQPQGGQPATGGQMGGQQPTASQFTQAPGQQPMGNPAGAMGTQQSAQPGQQQGTQSSQQQSPQPEQQQSTQPSQQQPTSYAGAFGMGIPQGGAPQQQFGATMGAAGQLTSQPTELYPEAFADHLTEEGRECLDDCIDVSQVAGWCADRCIEQGPQYAQCSRLCNEAATLGAVSAQFLAKDAISLPAVIEAYIETAEQAVEELSQFDTVHTNEAKMVIDRSIESSINALEKL